MNNQPPAWLHFWQRAYPSANTVLIEDEKPVLIDSGFGSDVPALLQWLSDAAIAPERLWLLINTHYHCDHAGGNHYLQSQAGVRIAAQRWEARLINNRSSEACSVLFLRQPIEPYRVDVALGDGDELVLGKRVLRVLHTPGHTLGHISLYFPQEKMLVCGDAVHDDDVSWINPFREGAGALERTMESIERLAQLDVRMAFSGHGAMLAQPQEAFDRARRRYEKWLRAPEKLGWHACKRIFAYALMLSAGLARGSETDYLLACPWFLDYSRHIFRCEPAAFVQPLLEEMLRSGAARWQHERLIALTTFTPPSQEWVHAPEHWCPPDQWSE
ncbi:MAG: hypothetical protein PVSMB5_16600 [Ktedonobacteraceae bacterium]